MWHNLTADAYRTLPDMILSIFGINPDIINHKVLRCYGPLFFVDNRMAFLTNSVLPLSMRTPCDIETQLI